MVRWLDSRICSGYGALVRLAQSCSARAQRQRQWSSMTMSISAALHWYLTFHDEALGVAVYAEYKFHEDVVEEQLRTINPIYLRNVGYQGLVAVLSKGRTLNSPQHGFPVTSVSMNYDWMYDALFPGSVAEGDYGHYVMAVFPRPGLVFKPTIRSGVCVDAYFQADRAKEFWTDNPVHTPTACCSRRLPIRAVARQESHQSRGCSGYSVQDGG